MAKEKIPNTLYYLTDEKEAETIREKGFRQGKNGHTIYLCKESDILLWHVYNGNAENAVVLSVPTDKIKGKNGLTFICDTNVGPGYLLNGTVATEDIKECTKEMLRDIQNKAEKLRKVQEKLCIGSIYVLSSLCVKAAEREQNALQRAGYDETAEYITARLDDMACIDYSCLNKDTKKCIMETYGKSGYPVFTDFCGDTRKRLYEMLPGYNVPEPLKTVYGQLYAHITENFAGALDADTGTVDL